MGFFSFVYVELLLHGMLGLLGSAFAGWVLPVRAYGKLQAAVLVSVFLFEGLVKRTGKYRRICNVLLEIGYPLAFAVFAWQHREKLLASGRMLFNDYVTCWNRQFGTNYALFAKETVPGSYMLTFFVAAFVLVALVLFYVTGVRLLLLLPDLTVLFSALLVNARPGWRGLALVFCGVVVLYAMPWADTKNAAGLRLLERFLYGFGVSVFAAGVVVFSGYVCMGVAEHIPEKTPQVYAFQQKIESRVKTYVQNHPFLGISAQNTRAHVDNTTPKYSGTTVLQMELSQKPVENLYLKQFVSGTYENDAWVEDETAFVQAVKQQGYDSAHVGMLLQQQAYERAQEATQELLLSVRPEPMICTLTYQTRYRPYALLPYFSDLSDAGKSLWVRGDACVQKKRLAKQVRIPVVNEPVAYMLTDGMQTQTEKEKEALAYAWYAAYVRQQYCRKDTQVASIRRLLKKHNAELAQVVSEENASVDQKRFALANAVQSLLQETASYNLYLDTIPRGSNAIDYFLETGKEGYCMHFASAGALLLQELGVPARYASGYVAKPSDFHEKKGIYVAEIPDYNAHAWVEIYLEQIGWVPVEMTPGYADVSAKVPTDPAFRETLIEQHRAQTKQEDLAQNDSTQIPSETEQLQAEKTDDKKTQQPEEPSTENHLPVLVVLLLLAAALLCAGGIWFVRHRRGQLLEELRRRQNRQALLRMNRRIYARLGRHAFSVRSDAQYLEQLVQTCPQVPEDAWKTYMQIMQKAVFSNEAVTQEDVQFCYGIYRKVSPP